MKLTKLLLATAVAAAGIASAPAAAVEVVFANITATTGTNFRWDRLASPTNSAVFYTTSTATGTSAGATDVLFSLSGNTTPLFVAASFLLSGSTSGDAAVVTGSTFTQALDSFTFTIRSLSAFTYGAVNVAANDVLLSGSVTNAQITGSLGGSAGALSASTLGGATIAFNPTPLLTFEPNSNFGLAFTLNSVSPSFTRSTGTALADFRAQASGSFQSDPAPIFANPPPPVPAIPEPSTWAMMIVGMGLVGFARRRRSTVVAA